MGLNMTDREMEAMGNGTFGDMSSPDFQVPAAFIANDEGDRAISGNNEEEEDQISRMDHFFNVFFWMFLIAACLLFYYGIWKLFG